MHWQTKIAFRFARRTARLVIMTCLLVIGSSMLLQAGEIDPESEYQFKLNIAEGAEFLANDKPERALARFKHAGRIHPGSPEVYFWIGLTYYELKNYGLAAKSAEKALLIDEKKVDAWLLWGQCKLQVKDWVEARDKLDHALNLARNNYLIHYNMGLCYYYGFGGKEKIAAKKFFDRALELNPRHVPSLIYKGMCLLDKGVEFQPIVAFQQAIKLDPKNVEAYFRLGIAFRKENRTVDAEKAFRQALRLNPKHFEAHLHLAHLYWIDLLDRNNARLHFTRFLETAPKSHLWYKSVATLLGKRKATTPDKSSTE